MKIIINTVGRVVSILLEKLMFFLINKLTIIEITIENNKIVNKVETKSII
jgi:hypothetical protein